jgi:hypothetical protein
MQSMANRKNGLHIRVPVLPDEAAVIKEQAKTCGLSTATYLRNLGLGFPISDLSAPKTVLELCRLHGDLARIGSLLEMWLLNDARLAVQDRATLTRNIHGLLAELQILQSALLETVNRL